MEIERLIKIEINNIIRCVSYGMECAVRMSFLRIKTSQVKVYASIM